MPGSTGTSHTGNLPFWPILAPQAHPIPRACDTRLLVQFHETDTEVRFPSLDCSIIQPLVRTKNLFYGIVRAVA